MIPEPPEIPFFPHLGVIDKPLAADPLRKDLLLVWGGVTLELTPLDMLMVLFYQNNPSPLDPPPDASAYEGNAQVSVHSLSSRASRDRPVPDSSEAKPYCPKALIAAPGPCSR